MRVNRFPVEVKPFKKPTKLLFAYFIKKQPTYLSLSLLPSAHVIICLYFHENFTNNSFPMCLFNLFANKMHSIALFVSVSVLLFLPSFLFGRNLSCNPLLLKMLRFNSFRRWLIKFNCSVNLLLLFIERIANIF